MEAERPRSAPDRGRSGSNKRSNHACGRGAGRSTALREAARGLAAACGRSASGTRAESADGRRSCPRFHPSRREVGQDPISSAARARHARLPPGTTAPGLPDHTTSQPVFHMTESFASVTSPPGARCAPSRDEIAQRARDLWFHYGQPDDCDRAIWLEAEERLFSAPPAAREEYSDRASAAGLAPATRARVSDRPTLPTRASTVYASSFLFRP